MPYALKELEKQLELNRFLKIEIDKDAELGALIELAAGICRTSKAVLILKDHESQSISLQKTFNFESAPQLKSVCNYICNQDCVVTVDDTLIEDLLSGTGQQCIKFLAGIPLKTSDGVNIGSLCVLDDQPGILTTDQEKMLKVMAKQAVQLLDFDRSLSLMKDLCVDTKRSEIELRSFFESSIDQHLLLGKKFEILAFNRTWERHVKNSYGLQMQKGLPMVHFIHQDNLRIFYRDYQIALNGTAVYDERNLKENGKDYWRVVKFEPAFNADNEIIGVSINVADVNKRVQQETTLKMQDEKLKEIALIQSHEFRKPVASILGLLSLIRLDGRINDMEELPMLEKSAKELDGKIRQIVASIRVSPE